MFNQQTSYSLIILIGRSEFTSYMYIDHRFTLLRYCLFLSHALPIGGAPIADRQLVGRYVQSVVGPHQPDFRF